MDFTVSRCCNKTRACKRVVFNIQIFYMFELGNKAVSQIYEDVRICSVCVVVLLRLGNIMKFYDFIKDFSVNS